MKRVSTLSRRGLAFFRPDGTRLRDMDPSAHGALSDTTQDNSSVVNLFEYPAIGDTDRDGRLDLSKVGMTLNGLVNLVLVGQNEPFHHVLQAWTGATGAPLPGFPKVIDDYGLTTVPLLVNVGATSDVGDTLNMPELVSGNGLYLVHAFDANGREPSGWPKPTGPGTWGSRRRVTSTTTAWSRSRGGRVRAISSSGTRRRPSATRPRRRTWTAATALTIRR